MKSFDEDDLVDQAGYMALLGICVTLLGAVVFVFAAMQWADKKDIVTDCQRQGQTTLHGGTVIECKVLTTPTGK